MFVEKKIINTKDLQIFILNFNLVFCNLILFINAMRWHETFVKSFVSVKGLGMYVNMEHRVTGLLFSSRFKIIKWIVDSIQKFGLELNNLWQVWHNDDVLDFVIMWPVYSVFGLLRCWIMQVTLYTQPTTSQCCMLMEFLIDFFSDRLQVGCNSSSGRQYGWAGGSGVKGYWRIYKNRK